MLDGLRRLVAAIRLREDPAPDLPEMDEPTWNAHLGRLVDTSFWAIARQLPALVGSALRMAWRASRVDTVAVLVLHVVAAAVTGFGLLATRPILEALFAGGPTPRRVWAALPALLVVAAATAGQAVLQAAAGFCQARLQPLVDREIQQQLFGLTSQVSLAAFDDPGFADEMIQARDRGVVSARGLVDATVNLATGLVNLAATAAALLVLHPLLLPVLLVAAMPRAWAAIRDARQRYASVHQRITLRRRLWMVGDLMADRDTAAELRAHQMRDYLMSAFTTLSRADTAADLRLARGQTTTRLTGDALAGVASVGVYVLLGALLLSGQLPLAAAGTAVLILGTARTSLYTLILSVNTAYEEGLYYGDLDRFRARAVGHIPFRAPAPPDEDVVTTAGARVAAPSRIRLEDVCFSYPGSAAPALTDITVTLERGQTVALVGENGSGKSTLAKLLACLYRPTSGTLSWDGVPTGAVDPDLLREHVAVIAQDFTRWPFTAKENIIVGRHTDPQTTDAVRAAADTAGAAPVISGLPRGYDTLLHKSFREGVDLSGGQWQRIAAARGFYRRPRSALLICDEPSAALDARAESHLFASILDREDHQTVVLITHRLANVRRADVIYVLHDGRIVEHGTHDQLLHRAGRYATLFDLQAAGYVQPAGDVVRDRDDRSA
ncbi:MAG: ABC transporter ATP-binding protein [Actinocatenispora sp.]